MARCHVAKAFFTLLDEHENDEETPDDMNDKLDNCRKQLQNITLSELRCCHPKRAEQMEKLREAVTPEIIEDVWCQPHNEIILHIDELYYALCPNDCNGNSTISETSGVWETLRMMSHCEAFVHASVADKAFLLISNWGGISFEKLRTILQIFLGLNDIQILAIFIGRENKGGLLRISQAESSPFEILEPIYYSGHKDYGTRSTHDDLLMLFYPYIPDDGSWNSRHHAYQALCSFLEHRCQGITQDIAVYATTIGLLNKDMEMQSDAYQYMFNQVATYDREFLHSLSETMKPATDSMLESILLQSIAFSGIPLSLDDLFMVGKRHGARESEVLSVLLEHFEEIVVCDEGESVRLRRVSEYLAGTQIDLSYRSESSDHFNAKDIRQAEDRLNKVIQEYQRKFSSHTFHNLGEKVHAFLKLWNDEIQLKELKEVALKLELTTSPESVSRVLKSYPDMFYSCENIGKRGFWCCRETAIRLGYTV